MWTLTVSLWTWVELVIDGVFVDFSGIHILDFSGKFVELGKFREFRGLWTLHELWTLTVPQRMYAFKIKLQTFEI